MTQLLYHVFPLGDVIFLVTKDRDNATIDSGWIDSILYTIIL